MADANTIRSTKHKKLTVEAEQNKEDPSKFYRHFMYKAFIVAIFLAILPLFPSQAPEFINQSLLTRNWELLHLLFVGIAISYGLFCRKTDETEKENNSSKFDNAQTIVSRFLQVSSFFEDDSENASSEPSDENKIQTWSNQYYRNDPVVVVASQAHHQHSDFEEQSAAKQCVANSQIGERPLLLPVRSLKSRLSESPGDVLSVNETSPNSGSLSRTISKSGSKRFSSNSNRARNAALEGPGSPKMEVEDKMMENVVFPSPIPWRSRAGRMEPKQEVETLTHFSSLPSMEESEFGKIESRSVKSQISRSSPRSNSLSSSASPNFILSPSLSYPKEISSSPSFSSEWLAKNTEDLMRKKGHFNKSSPPPPPPPPLFQKSVSMKPIRYGSFNEGSSFDKELKRSFTAERKDLNWSNSGIEVKPRGFAESMSMGKSVRTVKAGQNLASFARGRDIGEEVVNRIRFETRELEGEEHFMEEPKRKNGGFEHVSYGNDKLMGHANVPFVSKKAASMKFEEEEEKENFIDKVIMESDDEDTETEDEGNVGRRFIQKDSGESPPPPNGESSKTNDVPPSGSMGDEGPDVDKKADEFIAKFREQIRLQRIESIKRSTTKIARNSSR